MGPGVITGRFLCTSCGNESRASMQLLLFNRSQTELRRKLVSITAIRLSHAVSNSASIEQPENSPVDAIAEHLQQLNSEPVFKRDDIKRMPRYKELAAKFGLENDNDGTLRPNPNLRAGLTPENAQQTLLDTMAPLSKFSYDDQLAFKQERAKILVGNLTGRLRSKIPNLELNAENLVCDVAPVKPSPEIQGFRTKCEFACGTDITGAKKTIGYIVGRVRLNEAVVVPPDGLKNTPDSNRNIAHAFQDFIRHMSPLDACIWGENCAFGYWRGITVRSNRAGRTMAIVCMHPQKLTPAEIRQQMHNVKCYFVDGPGAKLGINSLYFQACPYPRCNHYQAPFVHLAGDPYIFEQLGDKTFRISPGAFYQLNPGGAEVLYDTIRDLLQPDGQGCLLDVCCGTGTIGIYMADSFKRVIGCDSEPLSIDDANHNARINKLDNCEFYFKPAEIAVPNLLRGFEYEETNPEKKFSRISAVVNPSRNGLEWAVIKALRQCKAIDDVIYVSCKPLGNAMRNIVDLALPRSQSHPGEPFYPVKVVPVDMFPNTFSVPKQEHCELVFMYQRKRHQESTN